MNGVDLTATKACLGGLVTGFDDSFGLFQFVNQGILTLLGVWF